MTLTTATRDQPDVDTAVARARARLDPPPQPSTIRQYDRIVRQFERDRVPLHDFTSRSAFYRARAALKWHAATTVLSCIDADGRPLDKTERDRLFAADHLLQYVEGMTPPAKSGGSRSQATGCDRSRRNTLKRLRQYADDLDGVVHAAARRGDHLTALAVLLVCGARPAELARGVEVEARDGALVVVVYGVKVNDQRGYGWRRLVFDDPDAWTGTAHLYQAARSAGGRTVVRQKPDALRAQLKRAATDVIGRPGRHVTPYVLRHLVGGRLKYALGPEFAARVLGHASVRSTRRYGGARGRGPLPDETLVSGNAPRPDSRGTVSLCPEPAPGRPS